MARQTGKSPTLRGTLTEPRRRTGARFQYLRGVVAELRKVVWPTREQATRLTLLVIAVSVAIGIFLALADIGFDRQLMLFERLGGLVIDSGDIRADPEGMLRKLCAAIDLPFDPAMLRWPAGPRPEDGVWAPHWYGAIHQSTGFAGPEGDLPGLSGANAEVMAAALPYYEQLFVERLKNF